MNAAEEARKRIEATYRARTPRSAALLEESRAVIPGGLTRSVAWFAPHPLFIESGSGCRVRDADGNEYVDLLSNFGSAIHGHGHPAIVAAVRDRIGKGTDFGSPTTLHLALARELSTRMPAMEQLRFTTSGSESILYAIRAARAFTGRSKILKMEGSYHGGYDAVTVSVDPGLEAPDPPQGVASSRGLTPDIAQHTLIARYNDLDGAARTIRAHKDELAAVLVEPVVMRGLVVGDRDFIHGLREVTRECGVLLLFDEIVTFRLARGGAQEYFGVAPDLATFGKILGGGLPLGAFGGRADVMSGFDVSRPGTVAHSGTYSGNSVAIAAGLAVLELLTAPEIERINALGDRLRAEIAVACVRAGVPAQVTGIGSLVGFHFTDKPVRDYRSALRANREGMKWLHLALLNRGVFTRANGNSFLSSPMGERDVDETAAAFASALEETLPLL